MANIYCFHIYIITNKSKTVLYTGVTNNLTLRLHQHKTKINPKSFTAKYNVQYLLYFEQYDWINQAIEREKEIKLMKRSLKLELIKTLNPEMNFLNDLFEYS